MCFPRHAETLCVLMNQNQIKRKTKWREHASREPYVSKGLGEKGKGRVKHFGTVSKRVREKLDNDEGDPGHVK